MKKSISFLLCGVMMMTGMYCKKDSSEAKEPSGVEIVQKLVRDSDFVQLYRGIVEYNERVGATGQVARFASFAHDSKEFNARSRMYFDQMSSKFPIDAEQGIMQAARVLNARYALNQKKEIELREILSQAVELIDPLVVPDAASARSASSCWDRLIVRESRCDRDMAIGGFESVIFGSAAVLAATGIGVPIAAGIAAGGLAIKWIKHSNCINDAIVDYKECVRTRM